MSHPEKRRQIAHLMKKRDTQGSQAAGGRGVRPVCREAEAGDPRCKGGAGASGAVFDHNASVGLDPTSGGSVKVKVWGGLGLADSLPGEHAPEPWDQSVLAKADLQLRVRAVRSDCIRHARSVKLVEHVKNSGNEWHSFGQHRIHAGIEIGDPTQGEAGPGSTGALGNRLDRSTHEIGFQLVPGQRQAMGGQISTKQVQRGAFAVDDNTVAVEKYGCGASHAGAVSRVMTVSP